MELSKNNNDRNPDGINITDLWGKYEKYVSKFMQNILRNSMTNNRFLKHVQKTERIN